MLWSGLNLHYALYFTALRNVDTLLFRKTDRSCVPASTWTVQNLLHNADAGRHLAQDCPAPLIDSPNGQYTNTGTHSSSLWFPFLYYFYPIKCMHAPNNPIIWYVFEEGREDLQVCPTE